MITIFLACKWCNGDFWSEELPIVYYMRCKSVKGTIAIQWYFCPPIVHYSIVHQCPCIYNPHTKQL